jgi:hypothetical protein
MFPIVMILVGFVAGLMTMTIVSLYKWFLKNWNVIG